MYAIGRTEMIIYLPTRNEDWQRHLCTVVHLEVVQLLQHLQVEQDYYLHSHHHLPQAAVCGVACKYCRGVRTQ